MSEDIWGCGATGRGVIGMCWIQVRGVAERCARQPPSQQQYPGQFSTGLRLTNKESETKGPFARVLLDNKPLKKLISVSLGFQEELDT